MRWATAPMVGIELEAYVMQPDGRGGWRAWDTPGAFVYGTGAAADPVGLFDEIMKTPTQCGLPIESVNSEFDAPQFELTLAFDDALQAVDNIFLFKVMAREIAARHELLLTFLGKPLADRSGSGMHVNFSLLDRDGTNRLADENAADGLSCLARQCIAGLIAHHSGMAALCVPTVNGYKRLRPGQLAGYWANWGYDHRGATLRVPDARGTGTRLEHRMSDGAANPYLATAAVLQAARLGRAPQSLSPPAPEEQDCLEHQSTDQHVPDNLGAALDALEADQPLAEAVGKEMTALFLSIKRAEWQQVHGGRDRLGTELLPAVPVSDVMASANSASTTRRRTRTSPTPTCTCAACHIAPSSGCAMKRRSAGGTKRTDPASGPSPATTTSSTPATTRKSSPRHAASASSK